MLLGIHIGMPNFEKFKKEERLTADWVNAVSRYLTNLTITGGGGIQCSKMENGFRVTYADDFKQVRHLITYKHDDDAEYPYDPGAAKYRCYQVGIGGPPADADDKQYIFVTMLDGAVPENTDIVAFYLYNEWIAFWPRSRIEGPLVKDGDKWKIGNHQVQVIESPLQPTYAVEGMPCVADWRDGFTALDTGYIARPISSTAVGRLTEPLAPSGRAHCQLLSSNGQGLFTTGNLPVTMVYAMHNWGTIPTGSKVGLILDTSAARWIVISVDCLGA